MIIDDKHNTDLNMSSTSVYIEIKRKDDDSLGSNLTHSKRVVAASGIAVSIGVPMKVTRLDYIAAKLSYAADINPNPDSKFELISLSQHSYMADVGCSPYTPSNK